MLSSSNLWSFKRIYFLSIMEIILIVKNPILYFSRWLVVPTCILLCWIVYSWSSSTVLYISIYIYIFFFFFLIWLHQVLVGAHMLYNLHCSMWDLILSAYRIQFPDLQCRRDLGLIPGLGRSSEKGHSNLLWYSCLENSMERGAWRLQSTGSQRVRHDWATFTFPDMGPPVLGAQS